ncbi:hypothetical protein [Phenylobacterium sp.]|uniref:hypothetical protein n=1 Tax=Phenylobacterium sp. TaxID=1871053 RepID=UPI003565C646
MVTFDKATPISGVMTRFRIHELSGVDTPAQEGARAVIMKRGGGRADDPSVIAEPEPVVDFAARKAATREAVDALAKAKAKAEGCTFEKAFDRLCVEMGPALGANLI